MRIKIFQRDNIAGLEREVNTWLHSNPGIEVINIIQSQTPRDQFWNFLMTVFYRHAAEPDAAP